MEWPGPLSAPMSMGCIEGRVYGLMTPLREVHMNRLPKIMIFLGSSLLPVAAIAIEFDATYTGATAGMVGVFSIALGIAEQIFGDE